MDLNSKALKRLKKYGVIDRSNNGDGESDAASDSDSDSVSDSNSGPYDNVYSTHMRNLVALAKEGYNTTAFDVIHLGGGIVEKKKKGKKITASAMFAEGIINVTSPAAIAMQQQYKDQPMQEKAAKQRKEKKECLKKAFQLLVVFDAENFDTPEVKFSSEQTKVLIRFVHSHKSLDGLQSVLSLPVDERRQWLAQLVPSLRDMLPGKEPETDEESDADDNAPNDP